MASQDDYSDSELIAAYSAIALSNYCALAAVVVVIYEYSLTIFSEIQLFLGGKLTGAVALFLANRYITLCLTLYELGLFLAPETISVPSCIAVARAEEFLDIFQYIIWAVFSGLRIYAVSRNRLLGAVVLVLSLVPFGVDMVSVVTLYNAFPDSCVPTSSVGPDLARNFLITSRTALIAADVIVLCTTWFTLAKRGDSQMSFGRDSLRTVLLRDGTIYFLVLFILNAVHLVLSLVSSDSAVGNQPSVATAFTEPLTSILVSRMLLNLQSANQKSCGMDSLDGTHVDSAIFQRVVGSLGGSIMFRDDELEEIVDDHHTQSTAIHTF